MKYTLYLIDKDPANNMTIHCKDSKEAVEYKRKAMEQGYKVTVKGEKKREPENLFTAMERAVR